MSEQATLDGMTPDQFMDIIAGTAMVRARSEFDRHGGVSFEEFQVFIAFGVEMGVNACFQELTARGLVVEKP